MTAQCRVSEPADDLQTSSCQSESSKIETQSASDNPTDDQVRSMGLLAGVMLMTGTMVGSGIFVTPSTVMASAGSAGWCLAVWGASGVVSLAAALAHVELASVVPLSGGDYVYAWAAFAPLHRFWGRLVPYAYAWTSTTLLRPCSLLILAATLARFAVRPLADAVGADADAERRLERVAVVLVVASVAALGGVACECAGAVHKALTVAKMAVLALMAAAGVRVVVQRWQWKLTGFSDELHWRHTAARDRYMGPAPSAASIATACLSTLWSYDGWNSLNCVVEQLHRPERNLALAVSICVPLTTLCYMLFNAGLFGVFTNQQVVASDAIAFQWAQTMPSPLPMLISMGVVVSTLGAAHGLMSTSSRLSSAAGRRGHLPPALSYVHVRWNAPTLDLMATAALTAPMMALDVAVLVKLFTLTRWIFYGVTMVAFIVLRFTRPDAPRPIRCPSVLAVLVLCASIFVVLTSLIQEPEIAYVYAAVYLAVGFALYVPFVHGSVRLPGMHRFNRAVQILFQVVPTKEASENDAPSPSCSA